MNKFKKGDYVIVRHVDDYDTEQGIKEGDVFEVLEANEHDILTTCEKSLFTDQITKTDYQLALGLAQYHRDMVFMFTHKIYAQGRVDGDEYNPKIALELLKFSEDMRKEVMLAYKIGFQQGVLYGE